MAYSNRKPSGLGGTWRKFPAKQGPTAPAARMCVAWSEQQLAFYQAIVALRAGENLALEARAGTGKTTSAIEACWSLLDVNPNASVAFLAFNKAIATELSARAPGGTYCSTVHSLGYKAVLNMWGKKYAKLSLGDGYVRKYAESFWGPESETAEDRYTYSKVVSMAKTRLASTAEDILAVMTRYSLLPSCREAEMASHIEKSLVSMAKAPGTGINGQPEISFDDMIWLPVVNGWKPQQFGTVFVDEAQDLSPARTELILAAVKSGGNVIVVGDPRQAIYSFAGADTDAFERLVERLNAKVLPLTQTRRCPKSVVREANELVPDLEALPEAPEGEVVNGLEYAKLQDYVTPGSAVISRTNAPLIKLFFRLVKNHAQGRQKVCLLGKDFGARLAHRIKSWQRSAKEKGERFDVAALLEHNAAWVARERERIERRGGSPELIVDQGEAIEALCADLDYSLDSEAGVAQVLARTEAFVDEPNSPEAIVLTSCHKAKGLEWRDVYMLADTYMPKWGNVKEEENLSYVAMTRSKARLAYVFGARKSKSE